MAYSNEGPGTGTTQPRPTTQKQADASVPRQGAEVFEQANGAQAQQGPHSLPGYPTPSPAATAPPGAATPAAGGLRGLGIFAPQPAELARLFEPYRRLAGNDAQSEEYPLDFLPEGIQDAVVEVAGATLAPVAMVAGSALGVLSTALQGIVDVARDPVLRAPASLFVLTLAESGERKTAVDTLLTAGLRLWDEQQRQLNDAARRAGEAAMRAWAAEEAGMVDALRKAAKEGQQDVQDHWRAKLAEHALRRPQPVRVPELLRGDDTPEALIVALTEWPVRAVVTSEAGLIFGSHSMSDDAAMRTLAQYNYLWDGKPIEQDRISRGKVRVEHARLTLSLQVQPGTFAAFVRKGGSLAKAIGFDARCLMSQPTSTQGTRFYKPPPAGMPALTAFHARVTTLLRYAPSYVDRATGHVRPFVLCLDDYPDAKAQWTGYHDAVEEDIAPGRPLHPVKDIASKSAEQAARLWGLFMLFCDVGNPAAEGAQLKAQMLMVKARRIARWYLDEALRIRMGLDMPESLQNALELERFLCKRCHMQGVEFVPMREVTKLGPKATRAKGPREDAVDLLVSHGHIRVEHDRKTNKSTLWVLRDVLDGYGPEEAV